MAEVLYRPEIVNPAQLTEAVTDRARSRTQYKSFADSLSAPAMLKLLAGDPVHFRAMACAWDHFGDQASPNVYKLQPRIWELGNQINTFADTFRSQSTNKENHPYTGVSFGYQVLEAASAYDGFRKSFPASNPGLKAMADQEFRRCLRAYLASGVPLGQTAIHHMGMMTFDPVTYLSFDEVYQLLDPAPKSPKVPDPRATEITETMQYSDSVVDYLLDGKVAPPRQA